MIAIHRFLYNKCGSKNHCLAYEFTFNFSDYIVEKQEEGSPLWEKVPGIVKDNSIVAKGLKEGKKYKFRVKAENMYGIGEPLESSNVLAKNPFGG